MLKRFLSVLLLAVLCWTAASAEIPAEEVDLDFTAMSGLILTGSLSDIRSHPEAYAGKTVRVRGQYYADSSGEEIQRSLIVCCSCGCTEIGISLTPAGDADLAWPELNQPMEVTAVVELYTTAYGNQSARLAVQSVLPL